MTKKFWLLFSLGASCALLGADLVLAKNGRTGYRIVINRTLPPAERTAAPGLAQYLRKIIGAEFPVEESDAPATQSSSTTGVIYIGWTAPGDNTPLKPFEQRVKSVGNDLYLSVRQDAENAVWLDQILMLRRPGPPRPQQVTLATPAG